MRNVFAAIAARSVSAVVLIAVLLVATCGLAQQVSYLVTAPDSSLSVYDLASNNLLEKINQGTKDRVVAVGPNSRLAFVGSIGYISVIDLTLGHEIQRIHNVEASTEGNSMAFTADGRLLVADGGYTSLDVIDAAALTVVRRVNLLAALGIAAYDLNTVLVVGSKAYVTSTFTDVNNPAIAVVDLTNYSVRSIAIPSGFLDYGAVETMPNAGITPDGRYLVTAQTNSDGTNHILVISTLTGRILADHTTVFGPDGILINPVVNPANQYGYIVGFTQSFSVAAIDLRPGSSTFGQALPTTEVDLPYGINVPSGAAISADGSRIVIGQFKASNSGPLPNVFVIDTAKLLVDPSHAIVANATVPGAAGEGVAIAAATLQAPPSAPTVTGVSGNITNDASRTLDVFGTNFASGAQVRIGSMPPLVANVISSTDVRVTVPANAPAAPAQDVVVTNPNLASPPSQQNQSGLLSGGLTIFVNPNFQPANQLATLNHADGSFSVYDFTQRAMTNVPLVPPSIANLTFNAAGTDLYSTSNGQRYAPRSPDVLSLKVATDNLAVIPVTNGIGSRIGAFTSVVSSRNPFTGGAVVYAWLQESGVFDVQVDMVDANPSSPTFNTVIATFSEQQDNIFAIPISGTATPDGKYVYVSYLDAYSNNYFIAVFDIVHGGPATVIDLTTINASVFQYDMVVTPDGQSLLLNAAYNGAILVEDISQNPLNPTPVTTITGSLGIPFLFSYQVVGNRLYALDIENNVLVAYNFDRQHSNFSRLGSYFFRGDFAGNTYIAVSPDGALLYVPLGGDDMISVLDPNKLATGQPPLITNLASFHSPAVVAVNPVSH